MIKYVRRRNPSAKHVQQDKSKTNKNKSNKPYRKTSGDNSLQKSPILKINSLAMSNSLLVNRAKSTNSMNSWEGKIQTSQKHKPSKRRNLRLWIRLWEVKKLCLKISFKLSERNSTKTHNSCRVYKTKTRSSKCRKTTWKAQSSGTPTQFKTLGKISLLGLNNKESF